MDKKEFNRQLKGGKFFATILHLAEAYHKQYRERGLCLSPAQNEACFKDFVGQYFGALRHGGNLSPVINPDIPLF